MPLAGSHTRRRVVSPAPKFSGKGAVWSHPDKCRPRTALYINQPRSAIPDGLFGSTWDTAEHFPSVPTGMKMSVQGGDFDGPYKCAWHGDASYTWHATRVLMLLNTKLLPTQRVVPLFLLPTSCPGHPQLHQPPICATSNAAQRGSQRITHHVTRHLTPGRRGRKSGKSE